MIHLAEVEGVAVGKKDVVGKEGANFHLVDSDSAVETDLGSTGCLVLGSSADKV